MNPTAVITLSNAGARQAQRLIREMPLCDLFLHETVSRRYAGERFSRTAELTKKLFRRIRCNER